MEIEVIDGKLFLNGKPLKLIGVNRHDAHPDFGYAVPKSIQIQDLQMLKKAGFNCIRGSHYPQSEAFLSLCDELGIMVWQEFPLACNEYPDDDHYLAVLEKEATAIVRKLRSHPP